MGTLTWGATVDYQPNGSAITGPLKPSGMSLLFPGGDTSWTTAGDGPGGLGRANLYQVSIPEGTEITSINQQIDVPVYLGGYEGIMTISYAGYYTPLSTLTTTGDGYCFEIVSFKMPPGVVTQQQEELIGQTFSVIAGGTPGVNVLPNSLVRAVPDAVITCFLAGACVEMSDGLFKAIEDIEVGDVVRSYDKDGSFVPVLVVRKRTRMVNAVLGDMKPIIVKKDAFRRDAPKKDLLVTPDHCLLLNDCLVPARMIVNNKTICIDNETQEYMAYHIETEHHALIKVDGLLTETYLDTSRDVSCLDGRVKIIGTKSWEQDAAAQLNTSRDFVEDIFKKINDRADLLGVVSTSPATVLSYDSDLRLVTDKGEIIFPNKSLPSLIVFKIPSDVEVCWLRSRTSCPSEVVGPFVDDRRKLGVLVGQIELYDELGMIEMRDHLTEKYISGWSSIENENARWTTGNARINLRPATAGLSKFLCISVLGGGPYLKDLFRAEDDNACKGNESLVLSKV